jgi:hypothetical protein
MPDLTGALKVNAFSGRDYKVGGKTLVAKLTNKRPFDRATYAEACDTGPKARVLLHVLSLSC